MNSASARHGGDDTRHTWATANAGHTHAAVDLPGPGSHGAGGVYVDCDRCVVRGPACADCVVTAILGCTPDEDAQRRVHLGGAERAAVAALSAAGLVAPLRLVTAADDPRP